MKNYIAATEDLAKLEAINRRLYDDRPLSGDQRRDLANAMNAILNTIKQCPYLQQSA